MKRNKTKEVSVESFNLPSGKLPQHTPAPILPLGRCNNCHWYYEEEIDECPNCKTNTYLMDIPEIARAVNSHEALLKRIEILGRMVEKATGWTLEEIAKIVAAQAEGK